MILFSDGNQEDVEAFESAFSRSGWRPLPWHLVIYPIAFLAYVIACFVFVKKR